MPPHERRTAIGLDETRRRTIVSCAWLRLPGLRDQAFSDPPESWEKPAPRFDPRSFPARPFRPTEEAQVPAPALSAIRTACGPIGIARFFVVPATIRLVTSRTCVTTPTKVLGFGPQSVAVWVDDGPEGRLFATRVDELIGVEDRRILLYGRLRILGSSLELVVRYNTAQRDAVEDNLMDLRRQMAVSPVATDVAFLWLDRAGQEQSRPSLPHKWSLILASRAIRLDPREPSAIAVGDVAGGRRGRSDPPSGVAILGPRELLIAVEPGEYLQSDRYGTDLLAIPRDRLDALEWDGRSLTVQTHEPRAGRPARSFRLPLDPRLVEAMRGAFGAAVRWS